MLSIISIFLNILPEYIIYEQTSLGADDSRAHCYTHKKNKREALQCVFENGPGRQSPGWFLFTRQVHSIFTMISLLVKERHCGLPVPNTSNGVDQTDAVTLCQAQTHKTGDRRSGQSLRTSGGINVTLDCPSAAPPCRAFVRADVNSTQ